MIFVMVSHALSKKAISLHKEILVGFQMITTVFEKIEIIRRKFSYVGPFSHHQSLAL